MSKKRKKYEKGFGRSGYMGEVIGWGNEKNPTFRGLLSLNLLYTNEKGILCSVETIRKSLTLLGAAATLPPPPPLGHPPQ